MNTLLLPASFLLKKGKLSDFIKGRLNQNFNLLPNKTDKRYWFHCASLGEFEQAKPLIENIKKNNPKASVVISFFSPSGYNYQKNYTLADFVFYLPLDTKHNAKKTIKAVQADCVIFIKYEIWYHFITQIHKQNIPCFLVSAVFRENQFIFKPIGKWLLNVLPLYKKIFLQNEESANVLKKNNISNYEIAGDTRYDRVFEIAKKATKNNIIEEFVGHNQCLILGSSWQQEESLLFEYLKTDNCILKIIIAPHDISEQRINDIFKQFSWLKPQIYTSFDSNIQSSVLILNTIGQLSNAYQYATVALVGGGFGKGLHNILEPLAHNVPVIFGPQTERYPEAAMAIKEGVAISIVESGDLKEAIEKHLSHLSSKSKDFIASNMGATDKMIAQIL